MWHLTFHFAYKNESIQIKQKIGIIRKNQKFMKECTKLAKWKTNEKTGKKPSSNQRKNHAMIHLDRDVIMLAFDKSRHDEKHCVTISPWFTHRVTVKRDCDMTSDVPNPFKSQHSSFSRGWSFWRANFSGKRDQGNRFVGEKILPQVSCTISLKS